MAQLNKVSRNNTTINKDGEKVVVTLHQTPVVTFDSKTIVLNNGGWVTTTTCTRMTQVSREYELGYSVGRKKGVMTASYKGKSYAFEGNTLTLIR